MRLTVLLLPQPGVSSTFLSLGILWPSHVSRLSWLLRDGDVLCPETGVLSAPRGCLQATAAEVALARGVRHNNGLEPPLSTLVASLLCPAVEELRDLGQESLEKERLLRQ